MELKSEARRTGIQPVMQATQPGGCAGRTVASATTLEAVPRETLRMDDLRAQAVDSMMLYVMPSPDEVQVSRRTANHYSRMEALYQGAQVRTFSEGRHLYVIKTLIRIPTHVSPTQTPV